MKMKKLKQTEIIPKLLDITYTIAKVYEKLSKYNKENNMEQYQQYLENLALCQQIENNIYHQLLSNKETFHDLLSQINWQNQVRIADETTKKLVSSRIIGYLTTYDVQNPFLSRNLTMDIKLEQVALIKNMEVITVQFERDYIKLLIYLIDQKIKSIQDSSQRDLLIDYKFDITLSNKLLENDLLTQTEIPSLDGRTRTLLFNHDPNLVTKLFIEESNDRISSIFDKLSFLDDDFEESFDSEDKVEYMIELIDLESALTMLKYPEVKDLYRTFIQQKLWRSMFEKKAPSKTLMDCKNIFQKVLTNKEKMKTLKP